MSARAAASEPPRRPWWPRLKRALALAFFLAVAVLIVRHARGVDWHQVGGAIASTPAQVLAAAGALTATSLVLYSCFDLLGRHYTGHGLPARRVMAITFISYSFNLNLGSLIGALAFRFRLYSRFGLGNATIAQVVTLSILTNWLGYLLLAGVAFTLRPLALPLHWNIDSGGLRWLGVALLATVFLYVALCLRSRRRSFTMRGHELPLPPLRLVPWQLGLSCANWMAMGAILYLLLRGQLPYFTVLSVLLVAAIAGVITHVPAGIGVLEAVFVALLAHQVPEWRLLAALLTYRALYYIAPLPLAAALYLGLEARARRAWAEEGPPP